MNYFLLPGIECKQSMHSELLSDVCKLFNVERKAVLSNSRKFMYIYPRYLFCYIAKHPKFSNHTATYREVGALIHRDHSTVIYYIQKAKEAYQYDTTFREKIKETQYTKYFEL